MKRIIFSTVAAVMVAIVLAAAKPVLDAKLSVDPRSDLVYGGEVSFNIEGIVPSQSMIDVQCYGDIPGGTGNIGWWDTKPYADTFVLGSLQGVAPPDMGNKIVLAWSVLPDTTMDCTARLWTVNKRGVMSIYDTLVFVAN